MELELPRTGKSLGIISKEANLEHFEIESAQVGGLKSGPRDGARCLEVWYERAGHIDRRQRSAAEYYGPKGRCWHE